MFLPPRRSEDLDLQQHHGPDRTFRYLMSMVLKKRFWGLFKEIPFFLTFIPPYSVDEETFCGSALCAASLVSVVPLDSGFPAQVR